jgi:hypothetical protein
MKIAPRVVARAIGVSSERVGGERSNRFGGDAAVESRRGGR